MFRNLPDDFTREDIVELLEHEGFSSQYDYVYVPLHFSNGTSFGYAFINLVSGMAAARFRSHFEGFSRWPVPCNKVGCVGWGDCLQGLDEQVERYRNSRIMHESVPDELKPAIYRKGVRMPFPPPTKQLRPPRKRPTQQRPTSIKAMP